MLRNLLLKPEALDFLDLPIAVRAGYIGTRCLFRGFKYQVYQRYYSHVLGSYTTDELTIEIPWRNLSSQPVLVQLNRIFVVAGTKTEYKVRIHHFPLCSLSPSVQSIADKIPVSDSKVFVMVFII